jgi:hypothetical protein
MGRLFDRGMNLCWRRSMSHEITLGCRSFERERLKSRLHKQNLPPQVKEYGLA